MKTNVVVPLHRGEDRLYITDEEIEELLEVGAITAKCCDCSTEEISVFHPRNTMREVRNVLQHFSRNTANVESDNH